MSTDTTVFQSSAHVLRVTPTDELLQRIAERAALDAALFDELKPFVFGAEISNNNLDAYHTRMAPSSLRNYAEDAERGVSFQNSHNTYELGFGRSISGRYEGDDAQGRVVAQFYTIPGLRLNGVLTDDLIIGIRSGIVSDVSIGFYGGRHVCDLCGFDLMDWENCYHYPGMLAEVVDPNDSTVKRTVIATATIHDARLAEVSAVYDGATPGAVILKARQAADAGRLQPKQARLLEAQYRINLPGARTLFAGTGEGTMSADKEAEKRQTETMPENRPAENEPEAPPQPPPQDSEHSAAEEAVSAEEARAVGHILTRAGFTEGKTLLSRIRAMNAEIERLRSLAVDGETYRRDLVTEALAEAVRAGLSPERYRKVCETADLETLKGMRDDWKATGDKTFTGGRKTKDVTLPEPKTNDLPDEAFMASR